MARAPKVYAADLDGVHEWIVAAPSQRAALEALGVHQDLFAQGRASVEHDPLKVEYARDQPGVALRRAKGSKGDFEPAGDAGDAWAAALKAAPAPTAAKPEKPARAASRAADTPAKPKPARKPAGPTADQRRALRDAEAALRRFERDAVRTLDGFDDERTALERRERDARADLDKRRDALTKTADKARAAVES